MGKIIILDENTCNKIAAGEVVEKPASVVKELVENSIDAGADNISIEIKNGGIKYIKVTDNGSGFDNDDVEIAFERHATSKIRSAYDLDAISTLGFRGEALASIAAVSNIRLVTRTKDNPHGMLVEVSGGLLKDVRQTGCPVGTTIIVKDLFFNTPARYKFLKKDNTEAGYVSDIVNRIALGNPDVSFSFTNNGSKVIHTPGNNDLLSTIYSVYGKDTAKGVVQIQYEDERVKITGFAGKPEIARSNRNHQSVFVNGRFVRSKVITSAVDQAYNTLLMKKRYAFIVLKIQVNPLLIDINVHPSKMEVKFSNEQDIFRSIYHAVNNAILSQSPIKEVYADKFFDKSYKLYDGKQAVEKYNQQKLSIGPRISIHESSQPINYYAFSENSKAEKKKVETEPVPECEKESKQMPASLSEQGQLFKQKIVSAPEQEYVFKQEIAPISEQEQVLKQEHQILSEMKIIGQAFSTYIILQGSDHLLLIDQHAAHERIMFERLKNHYDNNEPLVQALISPVVLNLTYQECKLLEDEKDFLQRMGYIYDEFGNNSIILRSVPFGCDEDGVKETFMQVVDQLGNPGREDTFAAADEILYTIACKAAVKANKRLNEIEIRKVLEDLSKMDNPFTCPHGRPTIIKIGKNELEKMFRRIV